MALARAVRRRSAETNYWPGFVDAMATLLLVIIFLLSFLMLAQFFLSQEISGRDTVLNRLNQQIAELTELLALERTGSSGLQDQVNSLSASLTAAESERARLQGLVSGDNAQSEAARTQLTQLQGALDAEKQVSQRAFAQLEILNQQIASLRRQIAALESALDVSEERDRESQTRIADMGRRLNVALAQKVQELARFRSDFFGRLREILSQRSDIRVVGDRFVFQSEVLFETGLSEVNPAGRTELDKLAEAILQLNTEIPADINWVLRVDGHTDQRPIQRTAYPANNWELSSSRAIAVVRYLEGKGVPPQRLVAAGFGEFHPLEPATSEEAFRRNRRIELKLTER